MLKSTFDAMILAQNIKLDALVQELLYNEDCIIIPGFGAFVCNYQSAVIEQNHKLILPPSKSISFNSQLIKNDGYLASKLSEIFEVSYDESNQLIENIVATWKEELSNKRFLELEGIGSFRKNEFDKLLFNQFTELNLLTNAYGLLPLSISPVKTVKKRAIVKELNNTPNSYKTAFKYVAAASLLLPFIFGVVWLTYNFTDYKNQIVGLELFSLSTEETDQKQNNTVDYNISQIKSVKTESDVDNFFDEKENEQPEIKEDVIEDNQSINISEVVDEKIDITNELDDVTSISKEKEHTKVVNPGIKITNKGEEKLSNESFKYAVIGGCFSSEENANNYYEDLLNKGYDAKIVGKSNSGLFQVAYSTHNSRVDALQSLAKIRVDTTQKGWILRK